MTNAVVQLASLNVPTNATNPKVSKGSGQSADSSGEEDDSSGDSGGSHEKKKGEKGAKTAADKSASQHKTQPKTYDAANQFLNKLLSGKKPAQPPI